MLLVGAATARAVHAECSPASGPGAAPANAAEMHEAELLYLPTPHHVVEAMLRLSLKSKLLSELRPGTRIVSHRFGLGDWPPERTIEAGGHPLLLWTVPHTSAPSPAGRALD